MVIEGDNVHLKCWPASITKLMLAAVVMEKLKSGQIKLDDKVTVSPEASSMGGSQVYLKPGEAFSLDEMMRAVMVASANDAAYAVAEFVAGSRNAFVDMMNEKARQLNMVDSQFHSMHGLPPSKDQEPDISSPCRPCHSGQGTCSVSPIAGMDFPENRAFPGRHPDHAEPQQSDEPFFRHGRA